MCLEFSLYFHSQYLFSQFPPSNLAVIPAWGRLRLTIVDTYRTCRVSTFLHPFFSSSHWCSLVHTLKWGQSPSWEGFHIVYISASHGFLPGTGSFHSNHSFRLDWMKMKPHTLEGETDGNESESPSHVIQLRFHFHLSHHTFLLCVRDWIDCCVCVWPMQILYPFPKSPCVYEYRMHLFCLLSRKKGAFRGQYIPKKCGDV